MSPMDHSFSTRSVALLLALAGAWNALVWGSRLRLMTPEEANDWANLARVVISLAFGIVLFALALQARRRGVSGAPRVLVAVSLWTLVVWIPSMFSVAAGAGSAAFKAVHVVLAVISLAFGAALAGQARREVTFNRWQRRSTRLRKAVPGTDSST